MDHLWYKIPKKKKESIEFYLSSMIKPIKELSMYDIAQGHL